MNDYNYKMSATWRLEPTSPAVLGQRFLRTLDLIAEAAPEIGEWSVVDLSKVNLNNKAELIPIDKARKIMTRLVEDNVAEDEGIPDPDYGYRMLGVNTPTITPRSLSLIASVGGRFGDRISFEAGETLVPSDPEVVSYKLFRTALLITIALWPSTWANAYAFRMDYDEVSPAPGIPQHPQSRYLIPWLSYLSAPLAAGLSPPAEIQSERTPDGGLLMIAAEERLDPTNPAHMRRSRIIANIMIERAGKP